MLAVLVLTFGYGRLPWVGLVLAVSFATYGVVKKVIGMPAVESLTVEAVLLIVPSWSTSPGSRQDGEAAFGHEGAGHVALMVGLGVITAVPLLLFGAAAPARASDDAGAAAVHHPGHAVRRSVSWCSTRR